MVREVTVDDRGEATGCLYLDSDGAEHAVRARIVCVSCSSVESARLLLLSRSRQFPNGLANGSGLVGRHLQFHGFSNGRARFHYEHHADKPLRHRDPFLECSIDHYFRRRRLPIRPRAAWIRFGFPAAI
jgi:choline dehydrogenase-like flavoprotein